MKNVIYLTDKQIAERYNVGRTTPWRWVQEGHFPPPVRLTPGTSRWKLSDLEAWEAERGGA